MFTNQSQATIIIAIHNSEDIDKISSMQLDLQLPQYPGKKSKLSRALIAEPVVVCELPVEVHETIPIKEAKAQVSSVTATLTKQNPS